MIVRRFEYFTFWNEDQIKECCELASIRSYKPLEIIFAGGNELIDPAYILLSGQCSIVQCLRMNETFRKDLGPSFDLQLPKNEEKASSDIIEQLLAANKAENAPVSQEIERVEVEDQNVLSSRTSSLSNLIDESESTRIHFFEIGTFSCGSIFGLGEHMEDRLITAKNSNVQCLLIPRYWLFHKRQNTGNIWQRTRIYLDFTLPSRKLVFDHYLTAHKWKAFKRRLICKSNKIKRAINPTQTVDIPIICRLDESL